MTRQFDTGATRDTKDNKLSFKGFLSPEVLECYAKYMHECRLRNVPDGQAIRSPDNWKKGMPKDEYADSLIRHVFEFWLQWNRGSVKNRDTLCAILFNTMGFLFEELNDDRRNANQAEIRPVSGVPERTGIDAQI